MTSTQLSDFPDESLEEVSRRLASGELDRSGWFYTRAELAAGKLPKPDNSRKASAA